MAYRIKASPNRVVFALARLGSPSSRHITEIGLISISKASDSDFLLVKPTCKKSRTNHGPTYSVCNKEAYINSIEYKSFYNSCKVIICFDNVTVGALSANGILADLMHRPKRILLADICGSLSIQLGLSESTVAKCERVRTWIIQTMFTWPAMQRTMDLLYLGLLKEKEMEELCCHNKEQTSSHGPNGIHEKDHLKTKQIEKAVTVGNAQSNEQVKTTTMKWEPQTEALDLSMFTFIIAANKPIVPLPIVNASFGAGDSVSATCASTNLMDTNEKESGFSELLQLDQRDVMWSNGTRNEESNYLTNVNEDGYQLEIRDQGLYEPVTPITELFDD